MLQSQPFANAVATVAGVGYVLCRLLAAVAPNLLFGIGQSWFHTLNLGTVKATTPMTGGLFVLGLLSSVVIAWVAAYATAELYNRWMKEVK